MAEEDIVGQTGGFSYTASEKENYNMSHGNAQRCVD